MGEASVPNRLADATSPYLLQHADNPVDWYEWGEEAFAAARERDVPIFLSVGYAACHWCHVMAHESFEHGPTAAYLNQNFVNVKVDREERPDIDAIYMEATQAMTGQGGWPMTCILTPAGEPFFAGTYFPRVSRGGMPALGQVLQALIQAWTDRRDEVTKVGADVAGHLQQAQELPGSSAEDVTAHAMVELGRTFDERHGGFGGAPKFPPSMVLEFLLRHAARTDDAEALRMADRTLEAMARGGIYDQLGGGFARYSVDERWDVPHFEKMLYDNTQLLRVYTHAYRQTASALAARVVRETARFMIDELGTAEGGFASALDADSDGEEGVFYIWTPEQLETVLGPDDAAYAREVFELRPGGNFEGGASTLRLAPSAAVDERFDRVRRQLLAARSERTRPARDDKVVAAWNGLAIGALAEAGVVFDDPALVDAARAAARLIADVHLVDGRLRRVSRDGVVGTPAGVLEDHACVADGLLALFAATGEREWYDVAALLVGLIEQHFADGVGGFFDTADDAESLLKRPQDPMDNASPSGQAMTLTVLVTMHGLTGDAQYSESAQGLATRLSGLAERAPRFAGQTLTALEAIADGPRQVAVVGDLGDESTRRLVQAAHALPHPGQVIAIGDGSVAAVPLLEARTLVDGRPTAYACHDFVCDLPVTDPDLLR